MKSILTAVIVFGLCLGAWKIHQFLEKTQGTRQAPAAPGAETVSNGDQLSGLPPRLQPALEAARQRGAAGLRDFLAAHGKEVADPRLAWIELDYVVVVAPGDPAAARKVFAQVKARLAPNSPAYSRMKQLEATYE
jgi:hypothetical protein